MRYLTLLTLLGAVFAANTTFSGEAQGVTCPPGVAKKRINSYAAIGFTIFRQKDQSKVVSVSYDTGQDVCVSDFPMIISRCGDLKTCDTDAYPSETLTSPACYDIHGAGTNGEHYWHASYDCWWNPPANKVERGKKPKGKR